MSVSLRIALDITHPAHFHFFKNAIRIWQQEGHSVLLLARDKDLTLQLLDEAGLEHQSLSRVRQGMIGLGLELVEHSLGAYRAMRKHRSQVVAAIGGSFIVQPARFLRIPSLVFYDTENAKLSNRITYPFASAIYTPRAYRDNLGKKQIRYNGYHETAYLHPSRFIPDPKALHGEGLIEGEPFTFVRLVSWQSHHDVGDFGVKDVHKLVRVLEQYGRVLISSESPLPADLKPYERKGSVGDVHHVMAFARLFFGESATMASESAMLGVTGIFLSTSSRGYTDEQETRYGMISNFNGANAVQNAAIMRAEEILSDPQTPTLFKERHARMLRDVVDVTDYIVHEVKAWAEHGLSYVPPRPIPSPMSQQA